MPFDGNGIYTPIPMPDFPAVSGTLIRAAQYNNEILDIAGALSNCMTRDGQGAATGNQNMGNRRVINLAAGIVASDAINLGQLNALAAEGRRLIDVQFFTASGTWNKPAGTTAVFVEVVGGGGGGGGAPATNASQVSCGSGGGGGGYTAEWITSGLGATETVTVGAGGAGVSGANGAAGTASSFGAHLTAGAGSGGFANGPSGGMFVASGGLAGGSSGGNFLSTGSAGHIGLADFASQSTYGGNGGNTVKGGGGSGVVASSAGVGASANTGGGGGGASNRLSQSARAGGNGASGIVIVYSYAGGV